GGGAPAPGPARARTKPRPPAGHSRAPARAPVPSAAHTAPLTLTSPRATPSRPAGGAEEADESPLPVPDPGVELPGGDVLPGVGPLTSNGEDTMRPSPSTTTDTGR
ncbi:hypothetical protein PV377_12400, partial [Streptomyces ipomoeae]|nr:hypothetical protein [Streptomyces ipomoeae]